MKFIATNSENKANKHKQNNSKNVSIPNVVVARPCAVLTGGSRLQLFIYNKR